MALPRRGAGLRQRGGLIQSVPVLLFTSALFLGFLHGLGADHLMAIAALSVGGAAETAARQRSRALGIAVRFAVGHALLLALGAAALLALGWSLPLCSSAWAR